MLSLYAYAPATARHLVPGVEPVTPTRSPYDPPTDLAPGARDVRTHELLKKGDVTFNREITWSTVGSDKPKIVSNRLVIESGNDADKIQVRSWPGDKLQFLVNGQSYVLDAQAQKGPQQSLLIKTNGGGDSVIIDPDVKHTVEIQGGDGDDDLQAGGGPTGLFGQGGDDSLRLGSGSGYAEGNDGDDIIRGGSGNTIMLGNNGNDRLYAGFGDAHKNNILQGGDGDDSLYAGSGDNHLQGGGGDDHLVGHDRTSFYTGEGHDRIWNKQSQDRIVTAPTVNPDKAGA